MSYHRLGMRTGVMKHCYIFLTIVSSIGMSTRVRFMILARAKRERVVQDGVEKANRRPDRHGTAPLAPYLKFDHF